MRIFDYVCLILILMGVGFIYRKYMDKYDIDSETHEYELIKKYLLNESSITKQKKPIIWIHIPYEYNAREWKSFYSRGSTDLNLPYQNLTIRSIIDHNESFHVCLIDDSSFTNLIPGWTQDINQVGDPIKSKLRQLCLLKLLYIYGGMIVPSSFLCLQDMSYFYQQSLRGNKPFLVENINRTYTGANDVQFMPDLSFMGAPKDNLVIKDMIHFGETIISTDLTEQSIFLGEYSKWALQAYNNKQLNIANGLQIGVKDKDNKPILADDLLENKYLKLPTNKSFIGIYIPANEMLSRPSINWFCYESMDKILSSNTALGKYFVLSQAPCFK